MSAFHISKNPRVASFARNNHGTKRKCRPCVMKDASTSNLMVLCFRGHTFLVVIYGRLFCKSIICAVCCGIFAVHINWAVACLQNGVKFMLQTQRALALKCSKRWIVSHLMLHCFTLNGQGKSQAFGWIKCCASVTSVLEFIVVSLLLERSIFSKNASNHCQLVTLN